MPLASGNLRRERNCGLSRGTPASFMASISPPTANTRSRQATTEPCGCGTCRPVASYSASMGIREWFGVYDSLAMVSTRCHPVRTRRSASGRCLDIRRDELMNMHRILHGVIVGALWAVGLPSAVGQELPDTTEAWIKAVDEALARKPEPLS